MEDKRPVILVTNDDGFNSKGLDFLAEIMCTFGDVYVVAPQTHQSGMAHALTFAVPVRAKCVFDSPNLHKYWISGTPVDCVKFGLDQILPNKTADLIVSGINVGSNSANSAIYSGTVACVREGAINNIPSIAFSALDFTEIDYEPFRPHIEKITQTVLEQGLDQHVFLNVNFPFRAKGILGMQMCRQAKGKWIERFEKHTDPRNSDYYWLTGEFHNEEPNDRTSDEWCLEHGIISIVPIKVENTEEQTIQKLSILNTL